MIYVVDGQGGGLGKALVAELKNKLPEQEVFALGTNSLATMAMIKAGADGGATGENAIVYNCAEAEETDTIVGAIGIIVANSMHGEISPQMAGAISSSKAKKILVPMSKCKVKVLGVTPQPVQAYISELLEAFVGRK